MPADKPHRIVIAHVTSAHGIRGDVVLKTHMDDPHELTSYGPLTDEAGGRVVVVMPVMVGDPEPKDEGDELE